MKKYQLVIYGLAAFPLIGGTVEKGDDTKTGIGVDASIGIGVGSSLYPAIHKTDIKPFFALDLSLNNFYIGLGEIGYNQPLNDNLTLSLFVSPFDGFAVKGKHLQDGYQSIQERKTQLAIGGRLSYDLNGLPGLTDTLLLLEGNTGKRGISGGVMLTRNFSLTQQFVLSPYIGTSYYSSKYTDYYFGIKEAELGGKITSVYKAKAAYAANVGINANYAFTDNIGIGLSVGWDKYSKQVKHSPIIKRDSQVTSALNIHYTF